MFANLFPWVKSTWKSYLILIKSAFLLTHIASVRVHVMGYGTVRITTTAGMCGFVCLLVRWHGFQTWTSHPSPKSTMLATLLCRQVHPILQKSTRILVIQKSPHLQCERDKEAEEVGQPRRGAGWIKWDAFIVIMVFPIFSGPKNTFTHNPHKSTCISILHIWYA